MSLQGRASVGTPGRADEQYHPGRVEEDSHVILFIDELHTIMGSGSGIDSTFRRSQYSKPALARGTLRTVSNDSR